MSDDQQNISEKLFFRESNALLTSLMFLTCLPGLNNQQQPDLRKALAWYPLAGLIIGALAVAPLLFQATPLLTSVLVLTVWVLITGGLHLDGLADMVDGWVGGMGDKTRTLKIIKDPAIGAMGAIALILVLILKLVALYTVLPQAGWLTLCAIPVIGRLILLPAFIWVPAAAKEGLAGAVKAELAVDRSQLTITITIVILLLALPIKLFVLFVLTAAAIFWLWQRAVVNRLGGFNGDCAGALVEFTELALLLVWAIAT